MKKVYVVLNEALYPDSGYNDIVGIFQSEESAKICVETNMQDLSLSIHRGENPQFGNGNSYEVEYDYRTARIVDSCGYYDQFRIEEHDLA